jgi:hypothetical protein
MEYYDSMEKTDLHKFYLEKSTSFLQHAKVIQILDKEDLGKLNESSINLFATTEADEVSVLSQGEEEEEGYSPLQTCPAEVKRRRSNSLKLESIDKRRGSNGTNETTMFFSSTKKLKKVDFKIVVQDELEHFNTNIKKIEEKVEKEILNQTSNFKEKKEKKLALQRSQGKSNFFNKMNCI